MGAHLKCPGETKSPSKARDNLRPCSFGLCNLQHFLQARQVEIDHDGAVDVEGGGGAVAACPALHLPGGAGSGGDIHLGVGQVVRSQPGARVFAIWAPFGAIHHNAAVGQVYRLGLGELRAVAHLGVDLSDGAAQFVI